MNWQRLTLTLTLLLAASLAPAQDNLELKLQTAFIYQFSNYVDWPSDAPSFDEGLKIGVVGDSPLFELLEDLAAKKKSKGRSILVRRADPRTNLSDHHIVVVTSATSVEAVAGRLRDKPVLIITKGPGLLDQGAMINFVLDDGKLRFEINRKLTEARKLSLSSQLLKLAKESE